MRKISELLEICKKYHELWGGDYKGMCFSAIEAGELGEMTIEEYCRVDAHCTSLVEEIDPKAAYLYTALGFSRQNESDRRQLKDWWENHINTLKENGL